MKFNVLGRKVEINITKKKTNNNFKNNENSTFPKRYGIFIFVIFVSLALMQYERNKAEYRLNEVANQDIVSSTTVKYKVNLLDDEVKEEIIESTEPEYDRDEEVSKNEINNLNNLLIKLEKIDENDNEKISKFIKENKLKIKNEELFNIIKRKDFQYYITLVDYLEQIYKVGIYNVSEYKNILSKLNITLDKSEETLLLNFIKTNLTLNKEKTLERINKNIEKLKNNERIIKAGQVIVKKGEKITKQNISDLEKIGLIKSNDKILTLIGTLILFTIISSVLYFPTKKYLKETFESKVYIPTLFMIILINSIYLILDYKTNYSVYLTPFYVLPVILTVLSKNKFYTLIITTFNLIILINDFKWLLVIMPIYVYMIYKNEIIKSRNQIVKTYIEITLFQLLMSIPYSLIVKNNFNDFALIIIFTLITGFISSILTLGLLPYFENTFQILTDIKLLELSDFSNPLLKKLLVIAPGSFHHSLMVGALSERAAEVINCNSIFVRVASYYHDIGKMKRPKYFIENQFEHINPHDKIAPNLSANIIISHVIDGVTLALQNNLPNEIIDVIKEHHGTTTVKYFYYKSLEQNISVNIEDFMYPGPKPKTKESAIIMLADSIEAAVRVQKDKRPEVIEELIRYLVNSKIEEKQLTDCNLTYNEIEKIIKAFLEVLQGAYHERIEYPKFQKGEK